MRSLRILLEKYDKPLIIEIKHSVFLGSIWLVLGTGAVLLVLPLPLPYGLGWGLAGAVLIGATRLACLHALVCTRYAVRRITLQARGACAIAHGTSHPWQEAVVVGWFVRPWLVILRLRMADTGRRRDVLVAWDALPAERFRQLRVWAHGLRQSKEA